MITVRCGPLVGRNVPPVATGVNHWCALGAAVAAPTTPVPARITAAAPHNRARWAVRDCFGHTDMRGPPGTGQGYAGVVWDPARGPLDGIGRERSRQGRFVTYRHESSTSKFVTSISVVTDHDGQLTLRDRREGRGRASTSGRRAPPAGRACRPGRRRGWRPRRG